MKNLVAIIALASLVSCPYAFLSADETPQPSGESSQELSEETVFYIDESEVAKYFSAKRAFQKAAGIPENVDVDITQFRYIDAYAGQLEEILWQHELDDLTFSVIFMDIDSAYMEYAGIVMPAMEKENTLTAKLAELKEKEAGGALSPEAPTSLKEEIAACEEEIELLHSRMNGEKYLSVVKNVETILKYAFPHELPPFIAAPQARGPAAPLPLEQNPSEKNAEDEEAGVPYEPKASFTASADEWSKKYRAIRESAGIEDDKK